MRLIISAFFYLAVTGAAQAPQENPDAVSYASIAANEVSQLHEGVTLAKWMETRGKREGWEFRKAEVDPLKDHPECLTEVKTGTLPSGAKFTRALYFYPPPVPSPLVFPTASSQALLNTCTLAEVRVEAAAPSPQIGHALDQHARKQLATRYGASGGFSIRDVGFCGAFSHGDAVRWRRDAEIVSGYDAYPDAIDGYTVAYVRACLPVVRKVQMQDYSIGTDDRLVVKEQFHRAVALAGVDAALSARFESLYDRIFQQKGDERNEDALPILRDWLGALKNKPTAQRAAGLLAVDRLVEAGKIPGWPEGRAGGVKDSPLQQLGAVFGSNAIRGEYFYTRSWGKQARELDPNGPVGQMALIGAMGETLWDTRYDFPVVIREGENLLKKSLDPPTAAQVHFMVGDAYSDIVALAGGLVGDEYSPEAYRPEAQTARHKALQHYRAALAVDKTSDNAKDAWRQAWHLSAAPADRKIRKVRRLTAPPHDTAISRT